MTQHLNVKNQINTIERLMIKLKYNVKVRTKYVITQKFKFFSYKKFLKILFKLIFLVHPLIVSFF